MRLIDADAYAAEMKKRQDACMEAMENASYDGEQFSPKEHWDGVLAAFAEAKLMLDDMQTVGGWISIKDRMPEDETRVIAYVQHKICWYRMFAWHDMYGWHSSAPELDEKESDYVTHWMPLPEPPKEASEDG